VRLDRVDRHGKRIAVEIRPIRLHRAGRSSAIRCARNVRLTQQPRFPSNPISIRDVTMSTFGDHSNHSVAFPPDASVFSGCMLPVLMTTLRLFRRTVDYGHAREGPRMKLSRLPVDVRGGFTVESSATWPVNCHATKSATPGRDPAIGSVPGPMCAGSSVSLSRTLGENEPVNHHPKTNTIRPVRTCPPRPGRADGRAAASEGVLLAIPDDPLLGHHNRSVCVDAPSSPA